MILFQDKKDCCGCGTCALVCPKTAIKMRDDEHGFVYPVVHQELCVNCGLCKKVCAFQQKAGKNEPKSVYAVSRLDKEELKHSASGGVFAGMATEWIKQGGVVFGSALVRENGTLAARHIAAESMEELPPLLGSKYVQSQLGETFKQAKKLLNENREVLFSGTPCQIASLQAYLGREYDNLVTVDLICHGVPSNKMFGEYIALLHKKEKNFVIDFRFRDKEDGWGLNGVVVYDVGGAQKRVSVPSYISSYYQCFLAGDTYRESCYQCPYAGKSHPADFTIGDFWGIEKEHPEYLVPEGELDIKAGISVLMVNSQKGQDVYPMFSKQFIVYPSSLEHASRENEQLNRPSTPGQNRNEVMWIYGQKGYKAVDRWFQQRKRKERVREWVAYHVHHDIPDPIRNVVKKLIRR